MVEKEAEKINSAVLKYIIMFVVIISLAGVMFKFVYLNIILGMGKSPPQDSQQEIAKERGQVFMLSPGFLVSMSI
jgi:hypothetical protein